MCLGNEERKLIGLFNPIVSAKRSDCRQYALNDIYCNSDEKMLLKPLLDKGYIYYGDTDFYWHLTEKGLAERNAYMAELPYPDKSHW